jgi:hypothetical protein
MRKTFSDIRLLDLQESRFDERKSASFADFASRLTNIVVCFLPPAAVANDQHA